MVNTVEKNGRKKLSHEQEKASLVHPAYLEQDIPYHPSTAILQDYDEYDTIQTQTELVIIDNTEIQDSKIKLETIFPIDPEVVHHAELILAAEKNTTTKPLSYIPPHFFLWNLSSYCVFWKCFWHDFSNALHKKESNMIISTT